MPSKNNQDAAVVVDALRAKLGNAWAFIQPPDTVWRASVSVLAIMILGMWTVRTFLGLIWAATILLYAVAVAFVCSRHFCEATIVRTEQSVDFTYTRWCVSWALLVNVLLGLTFVLVAVRFLAGNAFSANPEVGVSVDLTGAIAIVLVVPVTPMLSKVPALHSPRTTMQVTVDLHRDPSVQVTLRFCSGNLPKPDQVDESMLVDSVRIVFSTLYQ